MSRFWTIAVVAVATAVVLNYFFPGRSQDSGRNDSSESFPPRRPSHVRILPPSSRSQTRPIARPTAVAPLSSAALRKLAAEAGKRMAEAFSQSKTMHRTGSPTEAQRLAQEGREHQQTMERLNQTASEMIFREKNKDRKSNEVDLHGLFVKEAESRVKETILAAKERGYSSIRFIVGQGLHSTNGDAKLKPKLTSYIRELGRLVSLDPRNAGVLVVSLS